jgi:hypothetical protein
MEEGYNALQGINLIICLFPVATNYNDVWKKGSTPLKK